MPSPRPTDTPFTIRTATPADAAMLADFAARSFDDTFAVHNSEADMRDYLAATFSPDIQRTEIEAENGETLLVEAGSPPLCAGFAQIGFAAPSPFVAAPAPVEIKRFYVDRDHHGAGIAAALMDEILRRAGSGATIWLGVWEHNARAIRFYARHGFVAVGEQNFTLGSDVQRDIVMMRTP